MKMFHFSFSLSSFLFFFSIKEQLSEKGKGKEVVSNYDPFRAIQQVNFNP